MIPGWTHNIINLSDTENLVTVMTCNEIFNPSYPDTFFEVVEEEKSMACAIIEYLTDDEKRLKAGRESVDVIRKSYSLQQNIDKLERVYTEVERLRSDKLLQKQNGGK